MGISRVGSYRQKNGLTWSFEDFLHGVVDFMKGFHNSREFSLLSCLGVFLFLTGLMLMLFPNFFRNFCWRTFYRALLSVLSFFLPFILLRLTFVPTRYVLCQLIRWWWPAITRCNAETYLSWIELVAGLTCLGYGVYMLSCPDDSSLMPLMGGGVGQGPPPGNGLGGGDPIMQNQQGYAINHLAGQHFLPQQLHGGINGNGQNIQGHA